MYIDRAEAFRGTRVFRIRKVQNHFVPSLRERERETERVKERDRERDRENHFVPSLWPVESLDGL